MRVSRLLLFLLLATAAVAVEIGATRAQVIAEIGRPVSTARRGNREILLYPGTGRVEFEAGAVVEYRGPLPASRLPAAPVFAPEPPKPAAPVPPEAEPVREINPSLLSSRLGDNVANMETAWGPSPVKPTKPRGPLANLPEFALGLLLRFGLTLLAIQLAFKYWEMDAFWSGKLAIASIDVALHATLGLLGPVTGGFTTLGPVENGLPGLLLIATVRHFCVNKRLQNVLLTAAMIKTATTLLYIFGAVFALNAVFG